MSECIRELINREMEIRNWLQSDLSKEAKVNKGCISRLLSGKKESKQIGLVNMEKILKTLNLLRTEEEPPIPSVNSDVLYHVQIGVEEHLINNNMDVSIKRKYKAITLLYDLFVEKQKFSKKLFDVYLETIFG